MNASSEAYADTVSSLLNASRFFTLAAMTMNSANDSDSMCAACNEDCNNEGEEVRNDI
jgi:hypothetical protein